MPEVRSPSDTETGLGPWVASLAEGERLEPPELFRRACHASLESGSLTPEENRRLQKLHRALGIKSKQAKHLFQDALKARSTERRTSRPARPPELASRPETAPSPPTAPPVLHPPRIARALVEATPPAWNLLARWRHRRALRTWAGIQQGGAWAAWTLPTARPVERTVERPEGPLHPGSRRTDVPLRVAAVAFGEWGLLLDGTFVPYLGRRSPRIQVERRGDPALLVSWESGVPGFRSRTTLRIPVSRAALPRARGLVPQLQEHLHEVGFWRRAHLAMAAALPLLVLALRTL